MCECACASVCNPDSRQAYSPPQAAHATAHACALAPLWCARVVDVLTSRGWPSRGVARRGASRRITNLPRHHHIRLARGVATLCPTHSAQVANPCRPCGPSLAFTHQYYPPPPAFPAPRTMKGGESGRMRAVIPPYRRPPSEPGSFPLHAVCLLWRLPRQRGSVPRHLMEQVTTPDHHNKRCTASFVPQMSPPCRRSCTRRSRP